MQIPKISQVVQSMKNVDFSELKYPLITIYEKPLDFTEHFVARVWDGVGAKATNTITTRLSIEELREDIKAAGFKICFPRVDGDEPHVVETWMR